jgi:hypothetical protein
MKVMVPGFVSKEIGLPNATILLPMASRLRRGMKTTCCVCRKAITDETFIGAFFDGLPNKMMHVSCAEGNSIKVPEETGKVTTA